jgi:hypothetical protein
MGGGNQSDVDVMGTAAPASWGDTLNDEELLRLLKEWNTDEART